MDPVSGVVKWTTVYKGLGVTSPVVVPDRGSPLRTCELGAFSTFSVTDGSRPHPVVLTSRPYQDTVGSGTPRGVFLAGTDRTDSGRDGRTVDGWRAY